MAQKSQTIVYLRCDDKISPLSVADPHPVFSWQYGPIAGRGRVQTAVRIVVSHTPAAAAAGHGDIWDSGWSDSADMKLPYNGAELQPATRYFWRVTTRLADNAHAQSQVASFRIANPSWQAQWIDAPWSTEKDGAVEDGSHPMPIFRHAFVLKARPVEAILRIAGMGQWDASIGQEGSAKSVTPPGLHQAWTDYRKTVTYSTIDVSPLLGAGNAALSIMLGNGMYNVQKTPLPEVTRGSRFTKFTGSFGPPKLIAQLDLRYADGSTQSIASDASWKVERGPVVFDSTYGGEDFDARRVDKGWKTATFDDHAWPSAQVVDGPGGKLIPEIAPEVGQHEIYKSVHEADAGNGRTVYDLGQNFAGIVKIHVKGPAGAVVRLTPGELLNPDGTVSQATFHGPVWWCYTLRGDPAGETWEPLFDFGGFRYVQAEWTPAPGTAAAKLPAPPPPGRLLGIEGIAEHSDAPVTGTFASSSEMLNQIHRIIVEAMHNNEVSLLTDCPHREKLGWLEQTHLQAPSLLFNSDLELLMYATDRNMQDAQLPTGIVPTIAPQYTHFGPKGAVFDDSPEWGSASVLEPWWTYTFYRDNSELNRDYPMMRAYVAALQGKAVDGIVAYGLGDWYDIGPGGPGFEKNTSLGVTATLMLYEDAVAMEHIAAITNHTQDVAGYRDLASTTADAFNRKFWDAAHGWYDRGSQTANSMPLALGIVPAERKAQVLAHVVADIQAHNDHVTAGEIGYPYLLRALAGGGKDDVILAMMLRKDPPSYGSQLAAGATSLTEAWDANPHSSQDHFMLGSAEEWFYRRLGGMDIDMSRAAPADRVTLEPIAVTGVDWVRCDQDTYEGKFESDWQRKGDTVEYTITVPDGIEATVVLPPDAVSESRPLQPADKDGKAGFRVGPGVWRFTAKSPEAPNSH